jgi:hypothetical protein
VGQPQELLGGAGSFIPFSREKILSRYGSEEQYLRKYEAAARELMRDRYLLAEDLEELKKMASVRWDWAMQTATQSAAARE